MRVRSWMAVLVLLVYCIPVAAQSRARVAVPLAVASPNGALVITVGTRDQLTWSVALRDRVVLQPSRLGLQLSDGRTLGAKPVVKGTSTRTVDQLLHPVVRVKRAEVRDYFNEMRIDFAGQYALIIRAYDDGVAYRFATALPGEIKVQSEDAYLTWPGDPLVYFPEETSLMSHQERQYKKLALSAIDSGRFSSLPAMVVMPDGLKAVITEADLFDYPGMDLMSAGHGTLKGSFPAYPKKVELVRDRDEKVIEREEFIATTRGTREFPWRVLMIAQRDEAILESDIVFRLAAETKMTDTGWIRPGKVAWDWWNANNVFGVPFRAGVNTDTYKHYIDFAAEHGIPYIILDEGWYPLGNLLAQVPAIDMDTLSAYAKRKNVGLVMWVIWKTLDLQMQPALDQFARWGVQGIKVDFMQREDQWMVNFYERTAQEAAKRHLLVDFHGAYKPTGLYRTYPHVVTSEGVLGLEQSKWSDLASPDNAVTFPFMRMLAGPVDYTPGAMLNASKADFKPIFNRPMSQGTRCQQLAMYVVFESPLQMLADSPSNYRKEPESLAFLSAVPTVWDETKVVAARVGEYIVVARRSGREWYVGAMTNWSARDVAVDLSFLGAGAFVADMFRDGPNADRAGVDYAREQRPVTSSDTLKLHLAPGGGFVARVVPR